MQIVYSKIKGLLFTIVGLFLFNQITGMHNKVIAAAPNLTIDGAVQYQTMKGIGSNISAWSWKNGELKPALDILVDTLGHTIFRVVYDPIDWAGNTTTRPATLLTNLQNLDRTTLLSLYESPKFQGLWGIIGYLNSKGITGDQIILNFMGWTAPWMGGSGNFTNASAITDNTQINQDIATMIASLVYYAHHRRDVSGTNQNLSFTYLAPFNESDWNGLEGPLINAAQLNRIYEKLVTTLIGMGDTTTKLSGPDTAQFPTSYVEAFSQTVLTRMDHFAWHSYSYNGMSPTITRNGIKDDWMTERSAWCETCNNNLPLDKPEWEYGSYIGNVFLSDIANGFSTMITWEGFDTFYYHDNMYMSWGHLDCVQNGAHCTTSDTYPRTYIIRGRTWPMATIAKAIRPGMVRIESTTTIQNLEKLAFHNPTSGIFSLVGRTINNSAVTIFGQLLNIPPKSSASLFFTTATQNLVKQTDVSITNNQFSVTIPANTYFYMMSSFVPTNTTTPIVTKTGDANSDNRVDGLDYVIWLNHFGLLATGVSSGDFNNDSRVDGLDYVIWLNNYGR